MFERLLGESPDAGPFVGGAQETSSLDVSHGPMSRAKSPFEDGFSVFLIAGA